ncbi:MAG: hypothetical protein P1U58_18845 [Verrucomicrobiales bacterium]|nr:hypothetical protein [Verrucomicrobiales bacterium]
MRKLVFLMLKQEIQGQRIRRVEEVCPQVMSLSFHETTHKLEPFLVSVSLNDDTLAILLHFRFRIALEKRAQSSILSVAEYIIIRELLMTDPVLRAKWDSSEE